MTSRPALGTHGSGAPSRNQVRRPSKPPNTLPAADCIDPALEDERPPIHHGAEARPPPRGRPQLFYSTVASNGVELPMHPFPHQPAANLPAPPRPGSVHLRDASLQHRILPGGTGVKDTPRPCAPEAVPAPVQFPGAKAADVFPWTGSNAEDTLSEALVKGGISNKPQIMNETNTARPSLWSNLKNKSGLTTLSTLFVAVLEKRQQSGRLQTPNTFKPPPRLTLRDSTREAWLHDLANPAVSLRRLSRTIPHGLTGKVLLEQCLNKNIPLPRALWLAKCVGINELRAHKRKGQAGTVTWSRGWTSSVEQFLDSIISTIGQGDWKPRITYALQLATYLYKEHLLDHGHFLDWMLDGLDACPPERLFIWLLVVSVSHYWNAITSCRRLGKRLAETLLDLAAKLSHAGDRPPFSAALHYLENTLLKLLVTQPACALLPDSWAKHSTALKAVSTKRNDPQITHIIQNLDARNARLLQSSGKGNFTPQTLTARLVHKLDSVDYSFAIRIEDLAHECMELTSYTVQLISILLQWACSCYRAGSHRIYLATRLLRRWSYLGADVYEGIISYLQNITCVDSGEPHIVLRIVAELVRSKHFSAGRYLQWLIATGGLGHDLDFTDSSPWSVRLIIAFPLAGLSDQVRNLRCTLLRGTPHSVESEQRALMAAQHAIRQAVPTLFGLDSSTSSHADFNVTQLNYTVRLELGIWLRKQVAQHAKISEHVPTKDSIEETSSVSLLSVYEYHVIRMFLEQCEDLAILADVVSIAASSLNPTVLASVVDTLHYHLKAFRAIGAFDPLYGRITMRYSAIRTVQFPDRELILSTQNLIRAVRPDDQLSQLLSYDLSRMDQKNTMAACSPASDNMGEVMQHPGTYSGDEIERVLSSGTSMDQHMMGRVLRKIIRNLEEQLNKGYMPFENHVTWFWRLRSFDESTFDAVLHDWLDSCFTTCQTRTLRLATPLLVASGCLALSTFVDILSAYTVKSQGGECVELCATVIDGLRILLQSEDTLCFSHDAYRYRLEQYRLSLLAGTRILQCVGEVAQLVSHHASPETKQDFSNLLSSDPVISVMKRHIVADPGQLARMIKSELGWSATMECFKPTLNKLVDPFGRLQLDTVDSGQQVLAVFRIAGELSLPFCRVMIEHLLSYGADDGDAAESLSVALLDAVKRAVENDQSHALQMLTTLDSISMVKIHSYAEREILNASSFLAGCVSPDSRPDHRTSITSVEKYVAVVDLTSPIDTGTQEQSALVLALIDRFRGMAHLLEHASALSERSDPGHPLSIPELFAWLIALLRLALARSSTSLRGATPSCQTVLMASIRALLTHPVLELFPSMIEYVFDVATILSDHISDEARNHCIHLDDGPGRNSSRSNFVLGGTALVDGWLVLAKPAHPSFDPQTPSQPSTPITTHNQASPHLHAQVLSSGSTTNQQRFVSQPQQQRQQMQQRQQQQMRSYPQFAQQSLQSSRQYPAQLQRTPSYQALSPHHLSQQRTAQPSPIHSQHSALVSGQGAIGSIGSIGSGGGSALQSKTQMSFTHQSKEIKHYPFVQPHWEILAESSGNPNLNETAISMNLFGARKA